MTVTVCARQIEDTFEIAVRVHIKTLTAAVLEEMLPSLSDVYRTLPRQPRDSVIMIFDFSQAVDGFASAVDITKFVARFSAFCAQWDPITQRVTRRAEIHVPASHRALVQLFIDYAERATVPLVVKSMPLV